ncbi:hypothetical protein ACVBIL_17195 [Shewanella sp. 125m-7]
MKLMNINSYFVAISFVLISISGCTKINDFPMGESYYQVKQVQILDPDAAERNDGIILSLDGSYGQKVMQSYRASSVSPTTAKSMGSIRANSSGGSSSGSNN